MHCFKNHAPLTFATLALMGAVQLGHATDTEKLPAAAQVAVIGAEPIAFEQLPPQAQVDLAAAKHRYERQLHQFALDYRRAQQSIIETHANNFLDSKLMQKEAQARQVTVQELIKGVKNPEVTDADIHAFYEQNKQRINKPFDAALLPITQYLTQQAAEEGKRNYLKGLRAKYSARVTLEPLREDVPATGPSRGPANARVIIVEFSDFQCPYCGQMAPVLKRALDKYRKDVRLVYRQLPLADIHPNAMNAAKASVCAAAQGKFWEMHDALFADQNALSLAQLKSTAEHLGLQAKPFAECLEADTTTAAIKTDAEAGAEYGVNGTPSLFVNGRFFNGAISYEQIATVIDDELTRGQSLRAGSSTAGGSSSVVTSSSQ